MLTTREKVLILILIVLAGFGGLYQFYLVPNLERIDRLRLQINQQSQDVDAAAMRTLQYEAMSGRLEVIEEEWNESLEGVPYYFDTTGMLRLLQRVIYPHAYDAANVVAVFAEPRQLGELEVVATTVSFQTYRSGLNAVLNTFAGDTTPVNRIVEYSVNADNDAFSFFGRLNVVLVVDFITQGQEPPEQEEK